jgi:hypothetical protein
MTGPHEQSSRVAWTPAQEIGVVNVVEGVASFDFAEVDQLSRFKAWGTAGANATSENAGATWSAQTLGTGDILAGTRRHDRMVLVGKAPSGSAGPEIQVRDLTGNTAYTCSSTTIDQTELHKACLQLGSSGLNLHGKHLRGVAPWRRNGFLAVGSAGTVIATANNLDGPSNSWHHAGPKNVPLCDTEAVVSPFTVEFHGVARVGPSVIAVGEAGAVWLWRVKSGKAWPDGCWEEVDLGGSYASTTFFGVTADGTHEYLEYAPNPPETYQIDKSIAALIVGEDGVALRLSVHLDDPSVLGVSFTLEAAPHGSLWGAVDLHGVSSDDRTRVIVGDDNTVYTLPANALWTEASMWRDRHPDDAPTAQYRGVASDGANYVAVGLLPDDTNLDTNTTGLIVAGREDVRECVLFYEQAEDTDSDPPLDTEVTASVMARGDCLPPHAPLTQESRVWTEFSRHEPHLTVDVHDLDPAWNTDGTLTWRTRLGVLPAYADGVIRMFRTTVLADVEWDTDTDVDTDAHTDLESFRLTMIPDLGAPLISELIASSRFLRLPLSGDPYVFAPGTEEAPLHLKLRRNGLVDIFTGFKIDTEAAYFDGSAYNEARMSIVRGIIDDRPVDACGIERNHDYEELHTGGPTPDDNTTPNCGSPTDTGIEACYQSDYYLSQLTRLRSGDGHEYADMYEALGEGKQWRYHSMKHYLSGPCRTENAPEEDEVWTATCCVGEDEPSPVRLPLFALFDGTAFLYPASSGDDPYSGVAARETCGFPTPGPTPPDSKQVVFISQNGELAMLFDHVKSCLFDATLSGIQPVPPEGVAVEAGDRLGEWSPHRTFDVATFIHDEEDRWRLISYFDLLPPDLYGMYKARFGLDPRGTGSPTDPVISLKQRDQCPLRPVTDQLDDTADEKVTDFDLMLDTGCVPYGAANPQGLPVAPPDLITFP